MKTHFFFLLLLLLSISILACKKETVPVETQNSDFWRSLSDPSNTSIIVSLAVSDGAVFSGTGSGSVHSRPSATGTWKLLRTWPGSEIALSLVASNRLLVGTSQGVFFSSTTDTSFAKATIGNPLFPPAIISFQTQSAFPVFAGCSFSDEATGFWTSTDTGRSWEFKGLGMRTVYSIAKMATGEIVATSRVGVPWTPFGDVNLSRDGGASWVSIKGNLPNALYRTIVANSRGLLFVGSDSNGVFVSSNQGASWTASTTGLTNPKIRALVVNATDVLFAATPQGVFRSTTSGSAWEAVNSGLTDLSVHALALGPNGRLYAGTEHGRVFESTLPTGQ